MSAEDYIPDWEHDPYQDSFLNGEPNYGSYKKPYVKQSKTCSHCGVDNLQWYEVIRDDPKDNRWILVDKKGKKHTCKDIKLTPNTIVNPKKERKNMEQNIIAFLRDDAKTVKVRFFGSGSTPQTILGSDSNLSPSSYTYITELDLKIGQLVVVHAAYRPTVAVVVEVHDALEIQPNDELEYKWIISVISTEAYDLNMKKNDAIKDVVAKSYKNTVRKQFKNILLENMTEETKRVVLNIIEGEKSE